MRKILFVYILLMSVNTFGQNTLTEADKKEIRLLAGNKLNELKDLFNTISFEDATESQRREVILNSYLPGPSKVFYDDAVRIEEDINPENTLSPREVPVGDYLKNLDLFYKKTPEPSIEFNNVVVSDVLTGQYIYVRVVYSSVFKSVHKTQNKGYEPINRIVDIRADKIDRKWVAYITRVAYFNPVTDKFVMYMDPQNKVQQLSQTQPQQIEQKEATTIKQSQPSEIEPLKNKINTSDIQTNTPSKSQMGSKAYIGYHYSRNTPLNFYIGVLGRNVGIYFSYRRNFESHEITGLTIGKNEVVTADWGSFLPLDNLKIVESSLTGGLTFKLAQNKLWWYLGGGVLNRYSYRKYTYIHGIFEDSITVGEYWAKYPTDDWTNKINAESGLIYNLNGFSMNVGVKSFLASPELTFGVGIIF